MGIELEFITKKTPGANPNAFGDVGISLIRKTPNKADGYRVGLYIRNDAWKRITEEDYIVVAIHGDRLYFAKASKDIGYKLSKQSHSITRKVEITDTKLYEWAKEHIGDYYLSFDEHNKYWYINAKKGE
jgi:intein-encoded DNA endonuclease-like protein